MSNLGSDDIYVYHQPRPRRNPWQPSSPASWADRLRGKLKPYEEDVETITNPFYWVYLLVAFGILTLVLLGFYWILQGAKTAVAKKNAMTNARLRMLQQPQVIPPQALLGDGCGNPSNTFQVDNRGTSRKFAGVEIVLLETTPF